MSTLLITLSATLLLANTAVSILCLRRYYTAPVFTAYLLFPILSGVLYLSHVHQVWYGWRAPVIVVADIAVSLESVFQTTYLLMSSRTDARRYCTLIGTLLASMILLAEPNDRFFDLPLARLRAATHVGCVGMLVAAVLYSWGERAVYGVWVRRSAVLAVWFGANVVGWAVRDMDTGLAGVLAVHLACAVWWVREYGSRRV